MRSVGEPSICIKVNRDKGRTLRSLRKKSTRHHVAIALIILERLAKLVEIFKKDGLILPKLLWDHVLNTGQN